jgi:hypothetical protein
MWSCLPPKLLTKLFGYIDSKAQLAECRAVCKNWYYQADATLLGQHIILDNVDDVLKLYKFLNGDPARGSLAKHLTLLRPFFHGILLSQLVYLVFTPTLEKLEGRLEGCGSDVLLEINTKALNDASDFDKLTVLPMPQDFMLMYFNTLVKFKQSLQSMALHLTELHHILEQQYIVEHLAGFEALVVLDLKIKINDATDVEQVLQHFSHLEQLVIELNADCTFIMSEKQLSVWTASSVTVVESFKILQLRGCFFGDVFEYLCYKYPKVKTIKLNISEYATPSLLLPAYNMTKEQITIQSKRISKRLIDIISCAGLDITSHLSETDSMKLEDLALLLNRIGGTRHLKYDAEWKLITCVNLNEESAQTLG